MQAQKQPLKKFVLDIIVFVCMCGSIDFLFYGVLTGTPAKGLIPGL